MFNIIINKMKLYIINNYYFLIFFLNKENENFLNIIMFI